MARRGICPPFSSWLWVYDLGGAVLVNGGVVTVTDITATKSPTSTRFPSSSPTTPVPTPVPTPRRKFLARCSSQAGPDSITAMATVPTAVETQSIVDAWPRGDVGLPASVAACYTAWMTQNLPVIDPAIAAFLTAAPGYVTPARFNKAEKCRVLVAPKIVN